MLPGRLIGGGSALAPVPLILYSTIRQGPSVVQQAARPAVTDEVRELAEDVGDDRVLGQFADGVPARAALVGRFSPDTRVREGDSIEVAVYERALHFFDPESGLAI